MYDLRNKKVEESFSDIKGDDPYEQGVYRSELVLETSLSGRDW